MRVNRLILSLRSILTVLGIGAFALVGFGVFVYFLSSRETLSIGKYPVLRAKWDRELVSHFPAEIPMSASLKKLSHFPGSFQVGSWFQVRFALPPAEVAKVFQDASKQARTFYDGGGRLQLVNTQKDGLPGVSFHTAETQDRDFPADYRVFIYHARPYRPGASFQWNHGDSCGVVISRTRNEVIYFAEKW